MKRALLSTLIFCAGVAISGRFEHSSPLCLQLDFFKGKLPSSFFELRRDKSVFVL
jgi:hypothetical protein